MSTPRAETHASTPIMVVDVVSDIVCPWCYVGKRRLERALSMRPEMTVEVRWRPYFLNPWIPRQGMDRKTYLERKFGSVERYRRIAERVALAAAGEGLAYAFDRIVRQPNTLDCHRLILWARSSGEAGRIKQRLMEIYFAEGRDLSDREVLVEAAVACGMDGELVRQLLASDGDVDRVETEAGAARQARIHGVPCFIFGNALAVAGAQDAAYLADALGRAASRLAERATLDSPVV